MKVNLNQYTPLERSRVMYVVHAALEYLIAILVSGTFLATLTSQLGISDGMTAIISSVTSLCCLFQLLSVLIRRGSAKKLTIIMDLAHHTMMMSLFLIPFLPISPETRTLIFMVILIVGRIMPNLVAPKKVMWMLSLLDPARRGRFSTMSEMFSLIAGMTFTYVMSAIVDSYRDSGEIYTCFMMIAIIIAVIAVLNSLSQSAMIEPEIKKAPNSNLISGIKAVFANKKALQVALCLTLWSVAQAVAIPFYATYQIKELGYSLKLVSVIGIVASFARILASRFWGPYADKNSFAKMINKCFMVVAIGYALVCLSAPGIRRWLFAGYTILNSMAWGGINSGINNLIYDYTPEESRSDTVAFTTALTGISGFLTTLAFSPLVDFIQSRGNQIFGITIYAQQLMSAIALILTAILILCIRNCFLKDKSK